MVIDFHTHTFPDAMAEKTIRMLEKEAGYTAALNGSRQQLLESMDAAGVDFSVVLPVVTKPSQFHSINKFAVETNEKYNGRLLSFGGIHPDSSNYKEELREIVNLGLKGVKLHPDYQGVMIDDMRYMRIIDYASELGLIIAVHAGYDIGYPEIVHCPPDRARHVLDEVHPRNMILAHLGGWKLWDQVYDYLVGQDVYLDTAFVPGVISDELLMKIIKEHGADRILFATDSPWRVVSQDIEHLRGLTLGEEEKEKIFWKNAIKLLNKCGVKKGKAERKQIDKEDEHERHSA